MARIRRARISDLRRVTEIFIKEYSKSPYNEEWSKSRASKKLRKYFDNSDFFILEINKKIKGFAIVTRIIWGWGNLAFGEELVVSSDEQGRGYGRMIFDYLKKYYKNKGFKKFQFATNKEAKTYKFYKRLGYKETKMVLMEKKI